MARRSTHRRSKRTKSKGRRRTHRYYEKGGMPIVVGGMQALSPGSVGGGGFSSDLSPATFNEGLVPMAKPMKGGQLKLSPAQFGGGEDGKETFRGHGQSGGNAFAAALVPFSILGAQKYYQNNRRKGKSKRFSRAVKRYF
jgi:hypothetical protein